MHRCGARFTGAGGGGCLWAVGGQKEIVSLSESWLDILDAVPDAKLLDTRIDPDGILISRAGQEICTIEKKK